MDVHQFFTQGGYMVPNPNYDKRKKKNPQPQYILDNNPNHFESSAFNAYSGGINNSFVMGDTEKLRELGVTPFKGIDEQAELAENQSNLAKLRNALAQTIVSEIGLGTIKGVTDLYDYVVNAGFGTAKDNDYTNPVSAKIQEWQEKFKNDVAPIYTTPGVDISNGGLTDVGWWASNLPSVASSLTLLIPSTGVTKGLSYLGKSTGIFKGIGNARKALSGYKKLDKALDLARESKDLAAVGKAEKALQDLEGMSKLGKWANSKRGIEATNRFAEYGTNALISRVMENYQEASQVYSDMLPEMKNAIYGMNEQEYNNLLERNADILGDTDTSNKDAVAKRLAKAGADRTFRDDMGNVVFDIVELYGLRNFKGFMNGPSRASVRRAHLNSLKYVGLNKEEIAEKLAQRKWYKKAGDKISDLLYGSRMAVASQLSEGAEEAVNYIAQEEGMTYGHVLLGTEAESDFWNDRLTKYLKSPQLYESAFWGVAGGVIFQAGGSYMNRLQHAHDVKARRKKIENKDTETTGQDKDTKKIQERKGHNWAEDFELPEVTARKNDINRRGIAINDLKAKLKQIKEDKTDPFDRSDTPRALQSQEEQDVAVDRAYREFATNLLMDSMFSGNWNLTKEYLASDQVKQFFVEQGAMSQEEADSHQREVMALANKIEKSFDSNMRVIENAMRGKDEDTGVDFGDIPYEFYQIIAAQNMHHELAADQFDRIISTYQPMIDSEEARLANELQYQGMNYKDGIRAYILAKELGEVQAQLDNINKTTAEGRNNDNVDTRTIAGQSIISELETRKAVLTKMLGGYIEGNGMIGDIAKRLSIINAASATEVNQQGGYSYSRNSQRFKDMDAAIERAYSISKAALNGKDKTTAEDWSKLMTSIFGENNYNLSKEQFSDVYYQHKLFDELVGHALGKDGIISGLDDLSHDLLTAYSTVTYAEIHKQDELAHIAKGRKEVQKAAYNEFNGMANIPRMAIIEQANNTLKQIARDKYDEHGDISEMLAYGTINKAYRQQLQQILTPEELSRYDGAMRFLALSNTESNPIRVQDNLLPSMVKKAIYWSMRDNFEDVVETSEDPDDTIDTQNQQQSNSKTNNQNQQQVNTYNISKKIDNININDFAITNTQSQDDLNNWFGDNEWVIVDSIRTDGTSYVAEVRIKNKNDSVFQATVHLTKEAGERLISSANQNQSQQSQNQQPNNNAQASPSPDTDTSTDFVDYFSTNHRGQRMQKPITTIRLTNDGKPTHLDRFRDEDSNPAADLISIPGSKDTFALEFREKENDDLSGDVFGNEELFNGTEHRLEDGAVVTRLPKVTLNDIGEIVDLVKGEIAVGQEAAPYDVYSETQQPSQQSSQQPGTTSTTQQDGETSSTDNQNDEELAIDELQDRVAQETMSSIAGLVANNQELTEDAVLQAVKAAFNGTITDDVFDLLWNNLATSRAEILEMARENAETRDMFSAIADASSISDRQVGGNVASESNIILSDAFDKVLNNYLNRAYVEKIGDLPIISLTNLLRYCNEVGANKLISNVLYDYCLDQIHARNLPILEELEESKTINKKNYKRRNTIINDASTPVEGINTDDKPYLGGRTLDFSKVLAEAGENIEKNKELIEAINNLKAGDNLELKRETVTRNGKTRYFVTFHSNGVELGGIEVPTQNNQYYLLNNKGWIVDIPKSDDGSVSAIENLFIKCIVNPQNDPKYEAVKDALMTAYRTPEADKEGRNKALENIIAAVLNADKNAKQYLTIDWSDSSIRNAGSYLLAVYKGYLGKSSQWLSRRNMSEEDYRNAQAEFVTTSVRNWFSKLRESAEAATILYNNPNATAKVKFNNPGGVITTKKRANINEEGVIGEAHKGNVFIAVKPFDKLKRGQPIRGKLTLANGVQIEDDPFGAGNTKIGIRKNDNSYVFVNAFPNLIGASHFSPALKEIHDEVFAELERLMNIWGNIRAGKPFDATENLYNFLSKLCHARAGNTPLFGGIKVSRMTGGKEGLTIEFKDDRGRKQWINLFDRGSYDGTSRSNIQFPGEGGHSYWEANRDGKFKNVSKENFEKLKKILEQHLHYNIHENYVSRRQTISGFGTKEPNGKFVIQIPGGKRHEFDSYNDFILNEGVVQVDTEANKFGTNFYTPGTGTGVNAPKIHFDINTQSSSTGGQQASQQSIEQPINVNVGDEIKQGIINDTLGKDAGTAILDKLLESSKLKLIKQSKIIQGLSIKNIKFVPTYDKDAKPFAVHVGSDKVVEGVTLRKGDIVVTQRWVDLINENTQESKDSAARHLIHEGVHHYISTLPENKRKELFNGIREIFDIFAKANEDENLPLKDSVREFEFFNYRDNGGIITEQGLEEFLVESLTRPTLINRLNSISVDGKKLGKPRYGNVKSESLFKKLLSLIAKIFNLDKIRSGSLLEKEYKLFDELSETVEEASVDTEQTTENVPTTIVESDGQLAINFDENATPVTTETVQEPAEVQANDIVVEAPVDIEENTTTDDIQQALDGFELDDEWDSYSAIGDEINSLSEIRDSINPDNREAFEYLVDEGAIEINC